MREVIKRVREGMDKRIAEMIVVVAIALAIGIFFGCGREESTQTVIVEVPSVTASPVPSGFPCAKVKKVCKKKKKKVICHWECI